MLFKPKFDEERLKLAKKRAIEVISRRNETPSSISAWLFREMIYGKESPWGWMATKRTVKKIKRSDLVDFHQKFFAPNQMILAVSGDFKTAKLKKMLIELTNRIPKKELNVEEPKVPQEFKPQVAFAKKKSAQSAISIGHLVPRDIIPTNTH